MQSWADATIFVHTDVQEHLHRVCTRIADCILKAIVLYCTVLSLCPSERTHSVCVYSFTAQHCTALQYSRRLIKNPRSPDGKGPADVILHHTITVWIQHYYANHRPGPAPSYSIPNPQPHLNHHTTPGTILSSPLCPSPTHRVGSSPHLPTPRHIQPQGIYILPPTGHPRMTGGGPPATSSPSHRPDHTSPRRHESHGSG